MHLREASHESASDAVILRTSVFGRRDGDFDPDRSAPVRDVARRGAPAVRGGDGGHDRQPESGAAIGSGPPCAGPSEALERMRQEVSRETRAGIGYLDGQAPHRARPAASAARGPWRTVSVAAATCAEANAASTAAIVAGDDAADWLIAAGLPARLISHDGRILRTGGWPQADNGRVDPPVTSVLAHYRDGSSR